MTTNPSARRSSDTTVGAPVPGTTSPIDGSSRRTADRAPSHESVRRAISILELFSVETEDLSVGEISARLGMDKSVVSRIAATLRESALLERDPSSGRLRIGVGAFQLGTLYSNQHAIHRLALPLLGHLAAETRESAYVGILDRNQMLVVTGVESPQSLRVIMRVGERRHLHATASGKILLAFSTDTIVDSVLATEGLPALTPATITDEASLREELATVRAAGLAWNASESTPGAGAAAAPVFGADGRIAAAVLVVYPLAVDRQDRTALATHVRRTAAALTTAMNESEEP